MLKAIETPIEDKTDCYMERNIIRRENSRPQTSVENKSDLLNETTSYQDKIIRKYHDESSMKYVNKRRVEH